MRGLSLIKLQAWRIRSRSSHGRCSVGEGVLRNYAKFTGNTCARLSFFNKVAGRRPETLLKKRVWHRCFPLNFAKFSRTSFSRNTSGQLLLQNEDSSTGISPLQILRNFQEEVFSENLATTSHSMSFFLFFRSARFAG